jgi:hypothetical protein
VSHANAALTPKARLRLARIIIDDGWKPSEAAKLFMVPRSRLASGLLGCVPKVPPKCRTDQARRQRRRHTVVDR